MEGTFIKSPVGEVCECEGLDQRSWKIHNHFSELMFGLEEEGNRPTVLMFDSKFFFFFLKWDLVKLGQWPMKARHIRHNYLSFFFFFFWLGKCGDRTPSKRLQRLQRNPGATWLQGHWQAQLLERHRLKAFRINAFYWLIH